MNDLAIRVAKCTHVSVSCCKLIRRNVSNISQKSRAEMPYFSLHPWKSQNEFTKSLIKNVLYNKDGLVVLNKPYGISIGPSTMPDTKVLHPSTHNIPHAVLYGIRDSLPDIASELGHSSLTVVRSIDKYTTGPLILASSEEVVTAVKTAFTRAKYTKDICDTYWVVTRNVPKHIHNPKDTQANLALMMTYNYQLKKRKAIIQSSWSHRAVKNGTAWPFLVDYRVLSNGTENLSSLLEIQMSTEKHHVLRIFASTMLYCPVLGDNIHGSRVKKIAGTYTLSNPFCPSTEYPPRLDKELLALLHITEHNQGIIPVHIHLRSIWLPAMLGKGKDLVVEAPVARYFEWTCKMLKLKYELNDEAEEKQREIQQP